MKFSVTVIVMVLILELFLALSPLIPGTSSLWQASSPQGFYTTLATFVGIQFLLLTTAMSLLFLDGSSSLRTAFNEFMKRTPGTVVRRLRDDEFYSDFLAAARNARSSVRIAYFAPIPPDSTENKDRIEYYKSIGDLMRNESRVRFRRLIRHTEQNAVWVGSLVRELQGRANVDLAVLRSDVDTEMTLGLSTQIVDDNKVWFVAVASHERVGEFRDLYIEDAAVATVMTQYFDRLWGMSDEILSSGVATPGGFKYLQEAVE